MARFEREAIAGAHVRHPGVAAATDFGREPDGTCFLIVEHIAGVSLADVIPEGPMAPRRAARVASELAAALAAVHAAGIVHRDVKPRNILLTEAQGRVKLVDFGLAKVDEGRLSSSSADQPAGAEPALTEAGMVLGTVAYMAPETAQGMSAVDARADLYAVGHILYEMLAGKHAFVEDDAGPLFLAQRTKVPPPIAERAPGVVVPAALEAIAMRLLAKDPADRFQTAEDLCAALDAAATALDRRPRPRASRPNGRRHPWSANPSR